MFIINQDRNELINADNIVRIYIENEVRIMAETCGGNNIILGMYLKRKDKAYEVFKEMLDLMFLPNLVTVNTVLADDFEEKLKNLNNLPWGISVEKGGNIEAYNREVYYMPEE